MSRLSLKNDFKDGEILYGAQINTNNDATVAAVNDNYEEILKLKDIKADVVNVDNQLKTKVDVGTFNDAINSLNDSKADKSVVNQKADKTELANKADLIYVNNELSKKANISYVNTQLTQKANLSDVNSKLSLKADKDTTYTKDEVNTTIDNKIVNKADKTDLNSKADKSSLGDLSQLLTSDKSSAVAAINETIREGVANNIDALSITKSNDNKIQTVGVIDSNAKGYATKTWTGTRNEYNSIRNKNANTLYYIIDDDDEHELVANKVKTIDENSNNTQYPSAKAVYDSIKESAPDLSNYVQYDNYAVSNKGGVIKGNLNGFNVDSSGTPLANVYNEENYDSANESIFISKGTLENIKDDYVGTSEPINVLNDTLDNVIPKQNVKDSIININDALKYKTFNFKVDGAYKQTTSDGSNLLDIDYSTNPILGERGDIQASLNDDYSFTVTGNKTDAEYSNIYFDLLTDINIKAGTQYYSHDITLVCLDSELQFVKNMSGDFIADADYIVKRGYYTSNKQGDINEVIHPYLGTVPYDESKYYKYTGGNPSPNPDYPQEITSLNFDKITKIGQNLFDLSNTVEVTNNNTTSTTVDDDGFIHVEINNTNGSYEVFANYWTVPSKKLLPNHDYLVVVEVKEYNGNGYNNYVGTGSSTQFKTDFVDWNKKTGILTSIVTTKDNFDNAYTMLRTFIECKAYSTVSITYRISILADLTVNQENFVYKSYQGTDYSINLQGNETVALPNGVKDESTIDKEGNVNLNKKVGKVIYTDSNGFNNNGQTSTIISFICPVVENIPTNYGQAQDDIFLSNVIGSKYIGNGTSFNGVTSSGKIRINIARDFLNIQEESNSGYLNALNELIQSLNEEGKPFTIYYPLAEPQTISLGKLSDLITTEQGSNTFAINGNIDTQISTTYALDLKKYIDNKISTVSQAVIEQE